MIWGQVKVKIRRTNKTKTCYCGSASIVPGLGDK